MIYYAIVRPIVIPQSFVPDELRNRFSPSAYAIFLPHKNHAIVPFTEPNHRPPRWISVTSDLSDFVHSIHHLPTRPELITSDKSPINHLPRGPRDQNRSAADPSLCQKREQ